MVQLTAILFSFIFCSIPIALGMATQQAAKKGPASLCRRQVLSTAANALLVGALASPAPAHAAADCFTDCVKNCKKIAPKDPDYCTMNCKDYCEQEDRADGLSGSVSADNGEVGILGGTFGQGTVPKGEDKPPSIKLPGLDFGSDKGKKLLGY